MLEQGQELSGRYRIEEKLGSGGMGVTWGAVELETGRRVAIKALSLGTLADWKAVELFEREAQVLKGLDHASIPRYIDTLTLDDGDLCLVQELVEGASLSERLQQGWHPDEAEVRALARQLLGTLIYLHGRTPPVIHRDIKPQNVIMRPSGELALVDFGAVKDTMRQEGSFASTVVGTFGYMAPEQFRGHAVPSSDLYALGATLVYLLTRQDPASLPQKRLKVDFRSATTISERFAGWLDAILEPAPEDRLSSARAALDALDDLDRPEAPAPTPAPWGLVADHEVIFGPPPAGSRIRVTERDDGAVVIDLPPGGMRSLDGQKIFRLLFTIFWLSFITFWTAMALVTVVMALFSIPFWLVGFWMLWGILDGVFGEQRLVLGGPGGSMGLQYRVFGMQYRDLKGAAANLSRASLHEVTRQGRARGGFQGHHQLGTRLDVGVKNYVVGSHLSEAENRWLVEGLGRWIQHRDAATSSGHTLPPSRSHRVDERAETTASAEVSAARRR